MLWTNRRLCSAVMIIAILWGTLFLEIASSQEFGPTPPSADHFLGTAELGQDILRWTVVGAFKTLSQVLLGLAGAFFIGVMLACVSALTFQGWFDSAIVGAAETLRSFPGVLLVLLLAAMGMSTAGALACIYWLASWRVLRVQLHQEMNKGYYQSALSLGLSPFRSLTTHLIPNVLSKNVSLIVSLMAEMLTAECALEFLGLGPPLDVPSLGRQLFWAVDYSFEYHWTWLPAVIVITGAVGLLQFSANKLSFAKPISIHQTVGGLKG